MSEKSEGECLAQLARDIGHRVWEIRQERGLTQKELAEKLKASVQYIGRLERGAERNLQLNTLLKLATALDVQTRELFDTPKTTRPRRFGRPSNKRC